MREFGAVPGVIFGHHIGDVRENVIANAMKGAGILEVVCCCDARHTFVIVVIVVGHGREECDQRCCNLASCASAREGADIRICTSVWCTVSDVARNAV
jgi:hypothetical protein